VKNGPDIRVLKSLSVSVLLILPSWRSFLIHEICRNGFFLDKLESIRVDAVLPVTRQALPHGMWLLTIERALHRKGQLSLDVSVAGHFSLNAEICRD
jgi:hypothetical protein